MTLDPHTVAAVEQVVWSVVRGESADAVAVEPGQAGLDIPADVLAWAEGHGLSDDDPDVYLLVTTRTAAGRIDGEIAWREFPMAGDDLGLLIAALGAR